MQNLAKARALAIRYLSRRACHSKELEAYLKRKEFEDEASHLIPEFIRLGYLNDEEWLKNFRQTEILKGRGARASNGKLYQKGIRARVESSQEALQIAIQKKTKGLPYDRQKLIAYLLRRGFNFEDISNSLDVLLN